MKKQWGNLLPPWRLCRNVILRHQPKNLCFPTHLFYEILHGVYPEPKFETLRFTQGDRGEGFRMTDIAFPPIMTQSLVGEEIGRGTFPYPPHPHLGCESYRPPPIKGEGMLEGSGEDFHAPGFSDQARPSSWPFHGPPILPRYS